MNRLPMHEALKSIAWLEGTWVTEALGSGKFPTIKPFGYCEEISFVSNGQPMFNYVAQSWHPEEKKPMHREVGFLKVFPGTNKVSLLLSHNFGLVTVDEGVIEDNSICLKSVAIARPTTGNNLPLVTEVRREFNLTKDRLEHVFYMATENTPQLTEHLRARYVKKEDE